MNLKSALQHAVVQIKYKTGMGYVPYLPEHVDSNKLINEIGCFFGIDRTRIASLWNEYKAFNEEKQYAPKMGERKTFCLEEAFIAYVIFNVHPIKNIIEIGPQFGRSTRRIIDMKNKLGIKADITTYDIKPQVQFFSDDEAMLVIQDLTDTFRREVLEAHPEGGFLYIDAHPYHLLKNVIGELMTTNKWITAIHDCTAGLCNPKIKLSKENPNVTSYTGCWERFVLQEYFPVDNVLSEKLNDIENATQRLRIFSTPHGLAVIAPKDMNAFTA